MKRDFRSLNAQEALQVAVSIEERNATIYHQLGEVFTEFGDAESAKIADVFWEMAAEERDHSSRLQKLYRARYGVRACAVSEQDIREFIEVPKLDIGEILCHKKRAGEIRPPRYVAFEVAEKAENQALSFYRVLSENTADPKMRAVYGELAEFETEHCDWVRKKLAEARDDAELKSK